MKYGFLPLLYTWVVKTASEKPNNTHPLRHIVRFVLRCTKRMGINRIARERLESQIVVHHGIKFFSSIDAGGVYYRNSSKNTRAIDLLCDFLPAGGVAVDVGASIGIFTLPLAMKARKVYSFEPVKTAFTVLKRNTELNNLANVVCERSAVNSHCGEVKIFIPSSGSSVAHMVKDGQSSKSGNIEIVPGTTLDVAVPERYIDVLKIDVEGAELNVLRGAERFFTQRRGMLVIVEFAPKAAKDFGYSFSDMFDFFVNRGFTGKLLSSGEFLSKAYRHEGKGAVDCVFER